MAKSQNYPDASLAQNSNLTEFAKAYNNNSDSESGFKNKLKMVEGHSYTPPFDTIGFDQPKLCMDDVNRLRCMRLKEYNN